MVLDNDVETTKTESDIPYGL